MRSSGAALLLGLAAALAPLGAGAEAFVSKREALEQAFPGADRIDSRTVVLDDRQARAVEAKAASPLETRLATVHTAVKDGAILGFAFIDVHTVRTQPEAFLVVLDAEGRVAQTRILAFYEPRDYLPPERWLAQFHARGLDAGLSLDGDIHGIAGATLSSRAVTRGVRRSLALYDVLVASRPPARPIAPSATLAVGE